MVLPSMRRFGPLFQPVREVGVRRANSIPSGSSASLIVSREHRRGVSGEVFSRADIQLFLSLIHSFRGRRLYC